MHTEKNALAKQNNVKPFHDKYGILQLAANATLARATKSRWVNGILTIIRRLWKSNHMTIWMDPEPTDFICQIIFKQHMKKQENES